MNQLCITTAVLAALCSVPGLGLAQAGSVNPLTGTSLSFEQRQRRLEELKVDTLMLEEQAKQAELRGRLELAPIRWRTEERRLQSDRPTFPLPLRAALPARATPSAADKRGPSAAPSPAAPEAVIPAAPPGPSVAAILKSGDKRWAVVNVNGQTYTVGEGDQIAGEQVTAITAESVTVGARTLNIERRPAVVVAVDRQPVAAAPGMGPQSSPGMAQPLLPPLAPLPAPISTAGYSNAVPATGPLSAEPPPVR